MLEHANVPFIAFDIDTKRVELGQGCEQKDEHIFTSNLTSQVC